MRPMTESCTFHEVSLLLKDFHKSPVLLQQPLYGSLPPSELDACQRSSQSMLQACMLQFTTVLE